jgi:hypothetical protein
MKKSFSVICLLGAIVGCSSPGLFEPDRPFPLTADQPLPWPTDQSLPERYYVAEAALRHFIGKDYERSSYSAYVVDGREFTSQLVAAFQHHRPPVISGIRISTRDGSARNATTGMRVMLWSVGASDPNRDEATAGVSSYSGVLGAAFYALHLQRRDGKWIVVSVELMGVS